MDQIDRILSEIERIKAEVLEIKKITVLTFAEKEVYDCMKKGMSRRKIAEALFKSEDTVKVQVRSIKRKLELNN
ncbi:LuxR C-terminal-related transcriptional regulator [Metabacillus fastidiosus]|uniref:LuxR C-terminal-related transcriptional regulator n=1 Tax=Metabacillus fastidiosus TaxID=1458 RepID=UPI002E1D0D55|nr:LuxR C-terminal-related transcriptional regulator [Metabacillus fastidiosus]MED4534863.1 LuxR C-terminal-related transcriptional regulator [Metabacillus fastidiosus]